MQSLLGTALLCLLVLVPASGSWGHGDTIQLSYSGVRPERLSVLAGTTVHFRNANRSGAPCTVVIKPSEAKSPRLGRAGDWHHTFPDAGEFLFFVEEFPSSTGKIIVTQPPPTPSESG